MSTAQGRTRAAAQVTPVQVSALNVDLAGTLVTPGEKGWDEARAAWNLAADQHPAAVAYVETADDVARVIAFARSNGLRVTAQGTGHGAVPGGALDGTILVKTERMNGIEIDAEEQVGRFEAGVIWRDAGNAAAAHGLAGFPGSSPDVGVVGFTTGGGYSWLARRYGFACNNVRAIELVTADGEFHRIDRENEPDLFWALRGGGGSFAVVTAIEFNLVALPEVFAGSVIYPASGEILHRYREWTERVPDEITSIARFLHLPPLPEIPEPLRDRPLLTLAACYAGPESAGAELIAPLRQLGEPIMDLFTTMPPSELVTVHMDPEEPVLANVYTASLRELPEEAVETFVQAAGPDSGSPLVIAELRQAGGALAAPAEGAGALLHLDAAFTFLGVGMPTTPESGEAIDRHIDAILDALRPWSTGRRHLNFTYHPTELDVLFDPDTLTRLREVKGRYDPDELIRANHTIAIS